MRTLLIAAFLLLPIALHAQDRLVRQSIPRATSPEQTVAAIVEIAATHGGYVLYRDAASVSLSFPYAVEFQRRAVELHVTLSKDSLHLVCYGTYTISGTLMAERPDSDIAGPVIDAIIAITRSASAGKE